MKIWVIERKVDDGNGHDYHDPDMEWLFMQEADARFWCDALNHRCHEQWRKARATYRRHEEASRREYEALAAAGLRAEKEWADLDPLPVEVPDYVNQYSVGIYTVRENREAVNT
jgi:hypothetical protein